MQMAALRMELKGLIDDPLLVHPHKLIVEMEQMVNHALFIYNAEHSNITDYALESAGEFSEKSLNF